MLGRKSYTEEELANARANVERQLAAWDELVNSAADGSRDAVAALERPTFNNLALALDRLFVHRLRSVTGKDANPLNELELISESLMNNGGVLRTNNVIKYAPAETVLGLAPGDEIELGAEDFRRLSAGVLDAVESRFVAPG